MRDLFELVFWVHCPRRRKIGVPVVGHRYCIRKASHGVASCGNQEDADREIFDDDGPVNVFGLLVEESTERGRPITAHLRLAGALFDVLLGARRRVLSRRIDPLGGVVPDDSDELRRRGLGALLPRGGNAIVLDTGDELSIALLREVQGGFAERNFLAFGLCAGLRGILKRFRVVAASGLSQSCKRGAASP